MSDWLDDDWLLTNAHARRLYHEHAAERPIIDYHCHLDAHALANDLTFDNLTQLWIASDPYKHRAMRIAGVPERMITGDADDRAKFDAWSATLPRTLGNPLYAWSALELKRCFDIDQPLGPDSADQVWRTCNKRLRSSGFSARQLLRRRGVACVCTSDRLLDDLAAHETLAASDFAVRVLPSLRADDVLSVWDAASNRAWLDQLEQSTNADARTWDGFRQALRTRLDHFDRRGCRLADHGLDVLRYETVGDDEAAALYQRHASGEALKPAEQIRLQSAVLRRLGCEYARRGWSMQLHLGAQRQTSTRLRRQAGPAGGYATIGNAVDVPGLCRLLDDLEQAQALPRTILYPLNPHDYAALATLTGSFTEDGIAGKLQLGPAWWYNDHHAGIVQQLEALASYGLLSTFIGMTTDSRSLMSMTRHEYFRRVLCDWLGQKIERGELPGDVDEVGKLVRAIAYDNPRRWVLGDEGTEP